MRLPLAFLSVALFVSTVFAGNTPHKRGIFRNRKPLVERHVPNQPFKHPELQKRASRWLTEKTKDFAVNGTGIPEVPFDIGESYAGLLPISDAANETRKLFFWFFPSLLAEQPREITIWLNGGPGCSSLMGLLQENGPFTWQVGTLAPVKNPYSWHNLTNMVWVEQPVGVGYTQGVPNITNEIQLGLEFRGFFKQFVDTFDVHGYDVYVTGESYAGFYVPYIADSFVQANDTDYYNLKGIAINNPIIGDETNQEQVVALPFIEYWQNILYLNNTFMDKMRKRNAECNYTQYYDTYFKFPPPQSPFPVLPDPFASPNYTCDVWDTFLAAALEVNPCFNLYHIRETCPHPYSELGIINTGDYLPPGAQVYFNRSDVQQAIHAVPNTNWELCTDTNVFGNGNASAQTSDASPGPSLDGALARVIEYTNNVFIGSGNLDFILPTNGTLFAVQNMTWNGFQGLKEYPNTPLYVPYHPEYVGGAMAGAGYQGLWTSDRGLTFYTVQLSGHEVPGYAAGVGYRMLEVLLGRVKSLGTVGSFTTQSGNYTGEGTIYKRGMMGL